jgi:hypothetical protein
MRLTFYGIKMNQKENNQIETQNLNFFQKTNKKPPIFTISSSHQYPTFIFHQ